MMKKSTLEQILKITIFLTLLGIMIFHFIGINVFSYEGLIKVPTLITGVVMFWIFYISTGWRWPLLSKLVYQENINGTWFGEYSSRNFTTNEVYNGEIAIVIRQSFLRIDVQSLTDKYISYSFGEALNYNSKNASNQLIYLYSQSEFNPTDDTIRKGTSELILHFDVNEKKFFGDFWTNQNSKGTLNLKKVTSKHSRSFLEAKRFAK